MNTHKQMKIVCKFSDFLSPLYNGMWMGLSATVIPMIIFIILVIINSIKGNQWNLVYIIIPLSLIFAVFLIFSLKGLYDSCISYLKYKKKLNNGTLRSNLHQEFMANDKINLHQLILFRYENIINDCEVELKLHEYMNEPCIDTFTDALNLTIMFDILSHSNESSKTNEDLDLIAFAKNTINVTEENFLRKKQQLLLEIKPKISSKVLSILLEKGIINIEEFNQHYKKHKLK